MRSTRIEIGLLAATTLVVPLATLAAPYVCGNGTNSPRSIVEATSPADALTTYEDLNHPSLKGRGHCVALFPTPKGCWDYRDTDCGGIVHDGADKYPEEYSDSQHQLEAPHLQGPFHAPMRTAPAELSNLFPVFVIRRHKIILPIKLLAIAVDFLQDAVACSPDGNDHRAD